jgi:hypothetical protein
MSFLTQKIMSLNPLRTSANKITPAVELETDYIKAGILYKRGQTNPSWKRRYFILHSQNLYYYETSVVRHRCEL